MKYFFSILGLSLLSFCSVSLDNKKENIYLLQDSLFSLKDIKSTEGLTSLQNLKFTALDSIHALQFVVPVMEKEMKLDADYVIKNMTSFFVSKQKSIGDFNPIVISVNGDDYSAFFYIILDKENKPISHLLISGGLQAGPDEINDSLLKLCSQRHSFIKDDGISTYVLTEIMQPDSIKHPSIFDSVNYFSKLLPSGQFETKLIDSIRYKRFTK